MTEDERREKNRLKGRSWRAAHPGYATQKTKEMRSRDPGYWARWAVANRDKLREADHRYRDSDRKRYREQKRLSKRKWRKENPELEAIACLNWRIKQQVAT